MTEIPKSDSEHLGLSPETVGKIKAYIEAHVALAVAREALDDIPLGELGDAHALASSAADAAQEKAFSPASEDGLPLDERLHLVKVRDGATEASGAFMNTIRFHTHPDDELGESVPLGEVVRNRRERSEELKLAESALSTLRLE